jgi:hypothetical protein
VSKIFPSDKIYISNSKQPNAGRGVFAKRDIKKGEIIEACPVIEISKDDARHVNESQLVTYIYYLGKSKERLILALGYGSIYNHSYKPNAKYVENYKDRIIEFISAIKIKKNEEITVNYNQGNRKKNPLWFDVS